MGIEEFEKWAISAGFDVAKDGIVYKNSKTVAAFCGFVACHALYRKALEDIADEALRIVNSVSKTHNAEVSGAGTASAGLPG